MYRRLEPKITLLKESVVDLDLTAVDLFDAPSIVNWSD